MQSEVYFAPFATTRARGVPGSRRGASRLRMDRFRTKAKPSGLRCIAKLRVTRNTKTPDHVPSLRDLSAPERRWQIVFLFRVGVQPAPARGRARPPDR